MAYKVELGPQAEKFFEKTKDEALLDRIEKKLLLLEKDPIPKGSKLIRGSRFQRIKVGDYRIIYEIKSKVLLVLVIRIGHRRDVYKNL